MSATFVIALSPIAIAINQSLFVGELIQKLYSPNYEVENEGGNPEDMEMNNIPSGHIDDSND